MEVAIIENVKQECTSVRIHQDSNQNVVVNK